MDCNTYRDEFSALLDAEDPMLAPGVLDAHLLRCAGCAEWAEAATALHRATCVAPAPDVPDLVAPILAMAARQSATARPSVNTAALLRVVRLALASIGIAELITAASGLFAQPSDGTAVHTIHEVGAFDLALAVGFLAAAFRPALARGMLPLATALVASLAAVTVGDVVSSHAGWGAESAHLLSAFGVPMLWLAGRNSAPEAPRGPQWRHGAGLVTGHYPSLSAHGAR